MTIEKIPESVEDEWARDERVLWLLNRVTHVCEQLGALVRFPAVARCPETASIQLLKDIIACIETNGGIPKADLEVTDRSVSVMNAARCIVSLFALLGFRGGASDEIGSAIADLLYVRTTTKQPYRGFDRMQRYPEK